MGAILQEAGWQTERVVPGNDIEWISRDWFRAVRNAIVKTAKIKTAKSLRLS
jgi:hypothetical protein